MPFSSQPPESWPANAPQAPHVMSSQAEAAEFLRSSVISGTNNTAVPLSERGALVADGQLRALATRSGIYLTLRYGLSIVVSMANMFLLTRWIGPHAYGVFVTAVGLTTFLASLTRFGVDTYLVRCEPAPNRRQYDVAFTLVRSEEHTSELQSRFDLVC